MARSKKDDDKVKGAVNHQISVEDFIRTRDSVSNVFLVLFHVLRAYRLCDLISLLDPSQVHHALKSHLKPLLEFFILLSAS